jgi:preprotein translocase subunit SecE
MLFPDNMIVSKLGDWPRYHPVAGKTAGNSRGSVNMASKSLVEFFRQVRTEMLKVTWPSRKETTQSTVAVFIMVFVAAMFLFAADQVMSKLVQVILSAGT